jgi:hypothetical protein
LWEPLEDAQLSEWNAQNERMGYWSNQAGGRTIELITYEAGQHMQSSMVDVTNRDLRMGDIYTTYLNNWKDDVGNLMVMYTSCMKFGDDGAWGISVNLYTTVRSTARAGKPFVLAYLRGLA